MSVLSIGAIILIGGGLATISTLLATAAGSTAILLSQDKTEKPEKINPLEIIQQEQEQQNEIIKKQLQNFLSLNEQLTLNIELSQEKDKLNKKIQTLIKNLDKLNTTQIEKETNEIINIYNELIISNQMITYQKQDILNQIEDLNILQIQETNKIKNNINSISKQELENILNKSQPKISVEKQQKKDKQEEKIDYLQKINNILKKIKEIDPDSYKELLNLVENSKDDPKLNFERLQLELSSLRSKHIKTQIFKSQLQNHLSILNNFLDNLSKEERFKRSEVYPKLLKNIQLINDNLKQKYIEKENFLEIQNITINTINLVTKYLEYEEAKIRIKKSMNEILNSIGYNLIDSEIMEKLINNEVIYIDLPYSEEYKIQLKIDENNKIYYRLVKFGESTTEYEKQKDLEIAKKWCSDYDKLIELLKTKGIMIENIKRLEPGEIEILYLKEEIKQSKKEKQKQEKLREGRIE